MNPNTILQSKLSKPIRDLKLMLSPLITEKGDPKTNLIQVDERKTFYVPGALYEQLFGLLEQARLEGRSLHYSERQETDTLTHSGIMLDFDIYQPIKESQLSERIFKSIASKIGLELNKLVDYEKIPNFHVFFIRKDQPMVVDNKHPIYNNVSGSTVIYKDGIHILIPELQFIKGFKGYFAQQLLKNGHIKKVFEGLQLVGDADSMLDQASTSVPVHFFGNSKPSKLAYKLTNIIYLEYNEDILNYTPQSIKVTEANAIYTIDGQGKDINLTYELSLGYYLPAINGKPTWLKKRPIEFKVELETKIKLIVEKTTSLISRDELDDNNNSVDILSVTDAEAAYLKKMLGIIDISYATDYDKWFKVICAIAHTSTRYKSLAIWFSHRCPESWSQAAIDKAWSDALKGSTKEPVTKGSIKYWARMTSPAKFKEVDKESYIQRVATAVYEYDGKIEQADASEIVHSMVSDKFLSVSDEKGNDHWYEFIMPGQQMKYGQVFKWRPQIKPDQLYRFIGKHLPKVYAEQIQRIKDRRDAATDEAEAKYLTKVISNLQMYRTKLGNNGFQKGIIEQCAIRFRDYNFISEVDTYPNICGVGNGVLILGANPRLITGYHEYKIMKHTSIDYYPFDPSNEKTQMLLKAFKDIFPEEDVFNYMLFHAATGLDANLAACILTILVGGGQNGKSFFVTMVHNTLENMYCASGKSALLTAPMEKGEAANSAQMHMLGKRWFYFDEFNKYENLNVGRIKNIVNPGWQSGRDIYTGQCNFQVTCNAMTLSNYDFVIDTTDHGTWRRIYYYRNKTKFCKNPNADRGEKPVDTKFMDVYCKDKEFKESMLSILVEWKRVLCVKYGDDLKNVPVPTIARETAVYRGTQDTMAKFISKWLIYSPFDTSNITIADVAIKYIEWYRTQTKRVLTSLEVESLLENSCLTPNIITVDNIKVLQHHRLKNQIDDPVREGEKILTAGTAYDTDLVITSGDFHKSVGYGNLRVDVSDGFDVSNVSDGYSDPTVSFRDPKHIQLQAERRPVDNIDDLDI